MSKALQMDLIRLGYGDILGKPDGIIGNNSKKAIKQLQADHGLVIDGIVGVKTRTKMNALKKKAGTVGTRNFDIREFESPDTRALPKNGMDSQLLLKLEFLRWRLGNHSVRVTSGYRTKTFNHRIGGYWDSNHMKGNAADIKVFGVDPKTVQKEAMKIFEGVGIYKTFTHVDTDSKKIQFVGKY